MLLLLAYITFLDAFRNCLSSIVKIILHWTLWCMRLMKNHRHERLFLYLEPLFFLQYITIMVKWYQKGMEVWMQNSTSSTLLVTASLMHERRFSYQKEKTKNSSEHERERRPLVLIDNLAMRFESLHEFKGPTSVKKCRTYFIWWLLASCWKSWEEEINPSFQLQRSPGVFPARFRRADPLRAASPLAAAWRQAVVQRIAQGLRRLQHLRAAGRQRLLRSLPEQLQACLPGHLGDAGGAGLSSAAPPRLGRDGQAARVHHSTGGRSASLHALEGGNILGHEFPPMKRL